MLKPSSGMMSLLPSLSHTLDNLLSFLHNSSLAVADPASLSGSADA